MKRISRITVGLLIVAVLLTGLVLPALAHTNQPILQLEPTSTPSNTPTNTPVLPTNTPSNTPTPTEMLPTSTPSNTPTNTPVPPTTTPSNTPTPTQVLPSSTPSNTPTPTEMLPTSTPSNTPTVTLSPTASNTPTAIPSSTPTATMRPSGTQGCSANYWKQNLGSWSVTGFSPNQILERVFDVPDTFGLDNNTLLQALSFNPGFDTTGAARLLLRSAVPALLNSAHPSVNYPLSTYQVISGVNIVLGSKNRNAMILSAVIFDAANLRACPLH